MADGNGFNGAKAFGGVIAIIALITGIGAIVGPMQLNQEKLESRQERMEKRLGNNLQRDIESLKELMFDKFKRLEQDTGLTRNWIGEHDIRIAGTDSSQWERIKALERIIYGKPRGVPFGEGQGAKSED